MNSLIALSLLVFLVGGGEEASAAAKRDASEFCVFVAEVVRVIDGDTVVADAASESVCTNAFKEKRLSGLVGEGGRVGGYHIRLIGIDTPEQGERGFKGARRFARKWLKENPRFLVVYAEHGAPTYGKYGRLLGVIMPVPVDGQPTISLNAELVAAGLAEFVHFKHNDTINFLEWQIRQNSASVSSEPTAP